MNVLLVVVRMCVWGGCTYQCKYAYMHMWVHMSMEAQDQHCLPILTLHLYLLG